MSRATTTLLRLALVAPLSGAALLVAAAPASADIDTPGSGSTYDRLDTNVPISASVPQSNSQSTLVLKGPDGSTRTLETSSGRDSLGRYPAQQLRGNLDTDCASNDCATNQVKPARNGTWTVQLSGAENDSASFVLRIPPRAPRSVSAATTAHREITVTWTRGSEPDLTGFTVHDGNGAVLRDGISTSACSGTSCSTVFSYGEDDSGERTFRVRAHRSVAPGSSDAVGSEQSSSASATLAPKPAPKPTPTPEPTPTGGTSGTGGDPGTSGGTDPGTTGGSDPGTTGGSDPGTTGGGTGTTGGGTGGSTAGSGTSGGSTTGGSGSATGSSPRPQAIGTGSKSDAKALEQRRAFALTFRAFAPKLGIPKLPPLPKVQAPVVGEADLEDGTFEGTLGYEDQEVEEKVSVLGSQRIGSAVSGALDSEQLMRFVAAAMVMVLTAAHLRRWLGATAPDDL